MIKALQILSVTLVVGLSACSPASNNEVDNTIETQNALSSISGNWQFESIALEKQPPKTPTEPITLTLQVEANNAGRIYGNAGCNRFFGGYLVEDSTLKIGPLASTMMACEEPKMSQEREFLLMLEQLTQARLSGNGNDNDHQQLSLFNKTHSTELILIPLQDTPQ